MNYLGVDYGERKVGLAKAESETKIATPFLTLENDSGLIGQLVGIVEVESIEQIVIGLPVSFDGKEHEFAKKVREFGQQLKQAARKPVVFENEILSSKIAAAHSANHNDESAAALILQSFLDRS